MAGSAGKGLALEKGKGNNHNNNRNRNKNKTHGCCCSSDNDPIPTGENDKATELRIWSCQRPHMRAFHCSWISFFVSFFVWFSIVALLPYIQDTLDITDNQIWISNIFNLIPMERFLIGPLCDRYGPRRLFLGLLCITAIPTACTGLINTATGLYILRLFIGIAGGSFVICQYWSTQMFAPSIVGQANGFVGGWGNLGGGGKRSTLEYIPKCKHPHCPII